MHQKVREIYLQQIAITVIENTLKINIKIQSLCDFIRKKFKLLERNSLKYKIYTFGNIHKLHF